MFRLLHLSNVVTLACADDWIALLMFLEITLSRTDSKVGEIRVIFSFKKERSTRYWEDTWGGGMKYACHHRHRIYKKLRKVCMLCDKAIILLHLQMHPP